MEKYISTNINDFLNENNKKLLAPNGNISNLNKQLYNYVRTQEFKNWFGDWENDSQNSSKVLDINGEPLVCYHRSSKKFDPNNVPYMIGWLGTGFYFSDNKNSFKEYGKFILQCFLNIRTPFIVNGNSPSDAYTEVKQKYNLENENITIPLKNNGYDGVFFNHWDKGYIITCFNSSQIGL